MHYSYQFSDFETARSALKVARRMYPSVWWYVTNEFDKWTIVWYD